MLDIALRFLKNGLSACVFARAESNSADVMMCKVVDEAGKYAFYEEAIIDSIIDIEENRTLESHLHESLLFAIVVPGSAFSKHLKSASSSNSCSPYWVSPARTSTRSG